MFKSVLFSAALVLMLSVLPTDHLGAVEPPLEVQTQTSTESPSSESAQKDVAVSEPGTPWFVTPLLLFLFCFALGIIAVLAGVGGGVLFVPFVDALFPFHIDFVRGASIIVALAASLSAAPAMLKKGLASFRLVLPLALLSSVASVFGAFVGLALPQDIVRIALGIAIILICLIILLQKRSAVPKVDKADALSKALGIHGIYHEESTKEDVEWKVHRTPLGIILFSMIGFIAGMFGLGAGWASVPVFNLVLGVPLKAAVGSSLFLISLIDPTASFIYFHKGAVLPAIVLPAVTGMLIGSKVGAALFSKVRPTFIRWLIIILLAFAGLSSLFRGLHIF